MILIIIIPFVYRQKLRHERLKNLPKVRSQLLRDGARTLVHRETSTPRTAEQGTLSLQEGQALAGSWLGRGQAGQEAWGRSPEAIKGVDRCRILIQEEPHIIQWPVVGAAGLHELWAQRNI